MSKTYKILSIEAWRCGGSWDWNAWYHVGDIEVIPKTNRGILKMMREEGFLSETSKGKVAVTDDEYNLIITVKTTGQPLFAIEYGG